MTSLGEIAAAKTFKPSLTPTTSSSVTPTSGIQPDDFPSTHEAPMSERARSYLSALREVARHPTQKILIVGCRLSNIGDDRVHGNEKVVLWESVNESRWKQAPLPSNVGAVIFLRWISHPASKPIEREAKQRGLVYTGILKTGDVRQLLDQAFKDIRPTPWADTSAADSEAEWARFLKTPNGIAFTKGQQMTPSTTEGSTPSVSTPVPTPPVARTGRPMDPHRASLSAMIRRAGVRLDGSPTEEARRLAPMLPKDTDIPTAARLIAMMRVKAGLPNIRLSKAKKAALAEAKTKAATPAPAAAPAPVAAHQTPVAAPTPVKASDPLTAALKAIDAAMVALQRGGEALVAARTALVETRDGMNEIILKAVEDRYLDAMVKVRESFKQNG